mgnify:CR=1 FL=1
MFLCTTLVVICMYCDISAIESLFALISKIHSYNRDNSNDRDTVYTFRHLGSKYSYTYISICLYISISISSAFSICSVTFLSSSLTHRSPPSTFPSSIIMSLSISNQEVWFITTSYQSLYESIDEARWYVSAQSGHNNLSWQAGWYWHYASLLTYLWLPSLPRNHDIFFLVLQATIFENYQKCLILQHCKTRLFEYFFKHYARISWTLLSRIWRDADTVSKCPSPPFSMAFVEIWSQRHSLKYYRAFTTCSTLFPDP